MATWLEKQKEKIKRDKLARELTHTQSYGQTDPVYQRGLEGMREQFPDPRMQEQGLQGGMELGRVGGVPVSLTDLIPADFGANALATLGKAGIAKLGALPVMAGIFAGKGAKTANLAALMKAEGLKAQGVPDEQIWKETGWTLNTPDKVPRFEIPDNAAKFVPTKWERPYDADLSATQAKLGNALRHQELYNSYPSISEMDIVNNPNLGFTKGEYNAPRDDISLGEYIQLGLNRDSKFASESETAKRFYDKNEPYGMYWRNLIDESTKEGIPRDISIKDVRNAIIDSRKGRDELKSGMLWPSTDSSVKSTTLHELQHAIQQREGFARGGSPETMATKADYAADIKRINSRILDAERDGADTSALHEELLNLLDEQKLAPTNAFEAYQRLAGEAEARLTQSRMNMTPEQRLAQYPYQPEYFQKATGVPLSDLIVRQQ